MIRLSQRFLQHVESYSDWIATENLAAADRFINAIQRTLNFIEHSPQVGRQWPRLGRQRADIRFRTVRGFRNYLIFYRPAIKGIHVLALFHAARDIQALLEDVSNDE